MPVSLISASETVQSFFTDFGL